MYFADMSRGNPRRETSIHHSGDLLTGKTIAVLKEDDYLVKNYRLDEDAPKQFIKAYFHTEDSLVRKSSSSSWLSYIAKTADKWYPHESVIEYMINRAGQVMGVDMNQIRLVRAGGQIRFLSRFFLKDQEKLIHGAEICGEHLGDMLLAQEIAQNKQTSRELFTFQFITDALRSVFPDHFETLLPKLVKMIVFDELVGNNDRHFYNWGVIDSTKKTGKPPCFAPLYNSARGLLWNYSDENIEKITRSPGKKMVT